MSRPGTRPPGLLYSWAHCTNTEMTEDRGDIDKESHPVKLVMESHLCFPQFLMSITIQHKDPHTLTYTPISLSTYLFSRYPALGFIILLPSGDWFTAHVHLHCPRIHVTHHSLQPEWPNLLLKTLLGEFFITVLLLSEAVMCENNPFSASAT